MIEQRNELNLHPPVFWRQLAEKLKIPFWKEIAPEHIVYSQKDLDQLFQLRPDLLGDRDEIDTSLGGRCQSWRNNPGWWRDLFN